MKKSMIIVSVAVCMALSACGKESGEGGVDVINFQATGAETDVQQTENMENVDGADTDERQEDAVEGQTGIEGNGQSTEDAENTDNPAMQENTHDVVEDASKSEKQENTAENLADVSESEQLANDELVGNIESIEDGGFTISRVETEEKDDGVEIAVASLEDKVFVRVTYSASTKFVMCTVIDGINGQYTDAAASDLEKGRLVNMEGVYEGGEFAAQKITIYDFND